MASAVKRISKLDREGQLVRPLPRRARQGRLEKCTSAKHARARVAEVEVLLARSECVVAAAEDHGRRVRRAVARRARPGAARANARRLPPSLRRRPDPGVRSNAGLAALTRADIKEYASRRATAGASANTVRNTLAPLRAMLSTAVEDGLVRENVALRLPRVGRPPRQIEPPTREQVESVLAVAAPDARGPILVAASSGLRRGEVFGLRWNDIDFERRRIRVSSSNQDARSSVRRRRPGSGSCRCSLICSDRCCSRMWPQPLQEP